MSKDKEINIDEFLQSCKDAYEEEVIFVLRRRFSSMMMSKEKWQKTFEDFLKGKVR